MKPDGQPAAKQRPWRRAADDVAMLLLAMAIVPTAGLPLLELSLRAFSFQPFSPGYLVTHPTRRFQPKPNFTGLTYDQPLAFNGMGLRDEERVIGRGDETFRIALVGDSMSFGQGVRLDQTYPKVLEKLLRESGRPDVQVFNMSVPGYNLAAEWDLLREKFPLLSPHLVVFQFTIQDDIVPDSISPDQTGVNRFAAVRYVKDALRNLHSYVFLGTRLARIRAKIRSSEKSAGKPRSFAEEVSALYGDDNPAWTDAKSTFSEISEFSRANAVPVMFLVLSEVSRYPKDPADDEWSPLARKIIAALRERHLPYSIFGSDFLRGYDGRESELHLRSDDHHFNARAHALIAQSLRSYLAETGLLARPAPQAEGPR